MVGIVDAGCHFVQSSHIAICVRVVKAESFFPAHTYRDMCASADQYEEALGRAIGIGAGPCLLEARL